MARIGRRFVTHVSEKAFLPALVSGAETSAGWASGFARHG